MMSPQRSILCNVIEMLEKVSRNELVEIKDMIDLDILALTKESELLEGQCNRIEGLNAVLAKLDSITRHHDRVYPCMLPLSSRVMVKGIPHYNHKVHYIILSSKYN